MASISHNLFYSYIIHVTTLFPFNKINIQKTILC